MNKTDISPQDSQIQDLNTSEKTKISPWGFALFQNIPTFIDLAKSLYEAYKTGVYHPPTQQCPGNQIEQRKNKISSLKWQKNHQLKLQMMIRTRTANDSNQKI